MMTPEQAYRAYVTLARDLRAKRWTPADRQALESLYQSVRSLHAEHRGSAAVGDLEQQVRSLRVELRHTHYMSPVKKLFLGLGLAFLTGSTARYWINKLEPLVETYVHAHATAVPPPVTDQYYAKIDRILHERH